MPGPVQGLGPCCVAQGCLRELQTLQRGLTEGGESGGQGAKLQCRSRGQGAISKTWKPPKRPWTEE